MSEINDAVQIIKVGYEGIEIIMKVGQANLAMLKKLVELLIGMLNYEKSMGKTNMKKLIRQGGDLHILKFHQEELKKVEKLAKKYGILYSVLPDVNQKDGMMEICFHADAIPRMNKVLEKMKSGKIASFDDYMTNGENEEDINKLLDFLKDYKKEGEKSAGVDVRMDELVEKIGLFIAESDLVSPDTIKSEFRLKDAEVNLLLNKLTEMGAIEQGDDGLIKPIMFKEDFIKKIEKNKEYRELVQRVRTVSKGNRTASVDITISTKLIAEETEKAYKLRIPYEKDRFLWIDKADIQKVHDGKTLLSALDLDKTYQVFNKENQVATQKTGKELYDGHYDPVLYNIRKKEQEYKQKKAGNQRYTKKQTSQKKR